jgi:hypothetical protein
MGSLRIRLPKADRAQVESSILNSGLGCDFVRENGSEVTLDVIGDPIKAIQATGFSTVKRVSWQETTTIKADDRLQTIHVPRPKP